SIITICGWMGCAATSLAQDSMIMPDPMQGLSRQEKRALINQAASFYNAPREEIATAAKSTVTLYQAGSRVSYGTVVKHKTLGQQAILTKWSEINRARGPLIAVTPKGQAFSVGLTGVYPEHDLALLNYDSSKIQLPPLELSHKVSVTLGSFVLLAQPDGEVGSMGVVSVEDRSLREGDKAYLGVMMDLSKPDEAGIALKQIMPGSAAANAGLQEGDIILALDRENLTGAMEMRTLLQRLEPGSKVNVTYKRNNIRKNTTVQLGSLSENSSIRRIPQHRMEVMERMGATRSHRRGDFPSVIQSDMPMEPNDAGAPVTDLDGNIAGIAIARGSRIKTFIIPTKTIYELLSTPPLSQGKGQLRLSDNAQKKPKNRQESLADQVRRLLGKGRAADGKNR
ncbi:MAG: PDZ domain-containing protein, partial [Akkermansiaceae bacterium]